MIIFMNTRLTCPVDFIKNTQPTKFEARCPLLLMQALVFRLSSKRRRIFYRCDHRAGREAQEGHCNLGDWFDIADILKDPKC